MSSEQIIWIAGAGFASLLLLKMMRDRQVALNKLIRTSVEEKLEWARKKAKAAKMARSTARKKAAEEKVLGELFAPDGSPIAPDADAPVEGQEQLVASKSAA